MEGVGADISENALEVAEKNALQLLGHKGTEISCKFVQSNLFENVEGQFDVIVSNPPYIASGEIMGLDPSVRDHEPIWALDGGEDGLKFYKAIIKYWKSLLNPGGYLLISYSENLSPGTPYRRLAPATFQK